MYYINIWLCGLKPRVFPLIGTLVSDQQRGWGGVIQRKWFMDDPLNQQSPNINARLYISLFESLVLFTDKIMFGFVTFVFFFILDIKVCIFLIFIFEITLRRPSENQHFSKCNLLIVIKRYPFNGFIEVLW